MQNTPKTAPRVHPSVFMFLNFPFGALSGYLSVAVAYMLTRQGVSVERVATLVALALLPHAWKFAWAPIVDTTLTRKTWYMLGSVLTAVGVLATGALPATQAGLSVLSAVVLVSNIGNTFLGMAVESLMANCADEEEKGRAGGWFQVGNLGGAGVGGGAGLFLAQRLPSPWMAAAVVGGLCLACSLGLFFLTEPPVEHRGAGLARGLKGVGRDLWSLARGRLGFLAMMLCFMPIGSGAAGGLWSAVAGEWSASADTIALVTGLASGLISAAGCLAGGWVCDRMDRKAAYVVFGVLQAGCAVLMATGPRTEKAFIVFTSLYAFITGLTYAGFTAFALEAMGLGAAATKYSVFASLSNTPIYYMTNIDGWAHTRWGSGGMLMTEAACAVAGLAVFMAVVAVVRMKTAPAAPPVLEADPA